MAREGTKMSSTYPKLCPNRPQEQNMLSDRARQGPKRAQDAPRCAQDGPNRPQEWPKMALRPAKMAPRGTQDATSRGQDELKIPQDVPKMAPIGLKRRRCYQQVRSTSPSCQFVTHLPRKITVLPETCMSMGTGSATKVASFKAWRHLQDRCI